MTFYATKTPLFGGHALMSFTAGNSCPKLITPVGSDGLTVSERMLERIEAEIGPHVGGDVATAKRGLPDLVKLRDRLKLDVAIEHGLLRLGLGQSPAPSGSALERSPLAAAPVLHMQAYGA